jgi:hypothetical protein
VPIGDVEREQERQALAWQVMTTQCEDVRRQFHAAVELLGERTGLCNADVTRLIAERLEQKRSAS